MMLNLIPNELRRVAKLKSQCRQCNISSWRRSDRPVSQHLKQRLIRHSNLLVHTVQSPTAGPSGGLDRAVPPSLDRIVTSTSNNYSFFLRTRITPSLDNTIPHYFVSPKFTYKLFVKSEPLNYVLVGSTPVGDDLDRILSI